MPYNICCCGGLCWYCCWCHACLGVTDAPLSAALLLSFGSPAGWHGPHNLSAWSLLEALSMGLPVWLAASQMAVQPTWLDGCGPAVQNHCRGESRCLTSWPGAAMSSPSAVMDPARFRHPCCVRYTNVSLGMRVSITSLLHAACLLCTVPSEQQ